MEITAEDIKKSFGVYVDDLKINSFEETDEAVFIDMSFKVRSTPEFITLDIAE